MGQTWRRSVGDWREKISSHFNQVGLRTGHFRMFVNSNRLIPTANVEISACKKGEWGIDWVAGMASCWFRLVGLQRWDSVLGQSF